jgi:hypothetical protein
VALRLAVNSSLIISQDNATIPQETTFASGSKSLVDTTTYNYSAGDTYKIPAGAVDLQLRLGSLTEIDALFLLPKASGLFVKLVPFAGSLAATPATELVANFPSTFGLRLSAVYVSNPGATDLALVVGAAGN